MATRGEAGSQRPMVFDDAVVDNCQAPGAVGVRMGIPIRGNSVGGPARVGNPHGSRDGRLGQMIFEPRNLALGLLDGQTFPVDNGQTGRVVPAVFEPLQAWDEHLNGISRADVSYDSTHDAITSFVPVTAGA